MDKKSVLLVNPYIEDFSAYDHFSKPLGLLILAAYLKEHFHVCFLNALSRVHPSVKGLKFKEDGTGDFYKTVITKPEVLKDIPLYFRRYGIPEEAFLSELKALPKKPDYIFVTSGMTYWYTGVRYTISLLRQVFPDVKVILGGVYASLMTGHARKVSGADEVIPGQELSVVLDSLEKLTGFFFNREAKPPAYELLGEYYYAPVITSFGCVFQCSYCAGPRLSSFRQLDPVLCADTVENLYRNWNVRHFAFYDDALLYRSSEHLDVILENLISREVKAFYHTPNGLHIRFLTEKTAGLMKEAGFTDLRLSLESVDPDFQIESGGKALNSDFEAAMKTLYRGGFKRKNVRVYILLNIPGQSNSTVEKTMQYVYDRGALPMLAYYSPIPGTPDFKKAETIADLSDPLCQNNTVYLYRSGMDPETWKKLKEREKSFRRAID